MSTPMFHPSPQAGTSAAAGAPVARGNTYVHPGQLYVATTPTSATTILATCVAVCLIDHDAGIGGLNHFLLPKAPRGVTQASTRFGDVATDTLIVRVCALGGMRNRLRAKLFGGVVRDSDPSTDLGSCNIAIALETLQAHGIPLLAQDVGGRRSRKLIFNTDNGEAWVKYF